jgi:hypothetical protein
MIILPHPVPEGLAGSGCLCKRFTRFLPVDADEALSFCFVLFTPILVVFIDWAFPRSAHGAADLHE